MKLDRSSKVFHCEYKDCSHTLSSKSNLLKHVKAVHFQDKPFVCGFPDCGMRFAYKHVRDNHEKTSSHVFILRRCEDDGLLDLSEDDFFLAGSSNDEADANDEWTDKSTSKWTSCRSLWDLSRLQRGLRLCANEMECSEK